MTRLVTVKKEVQKLRQKVAPKPRDEIWVVFWAPPDDDEDTDVECVEMHSGKKFKCKYADVNYMIRLQNHESDVERGQRSFQKF